MAEELTVESLPLADRLTAANLVGRRAAWTLDTFPAQAGTTVLSDAARGYARVAAPAPPGLLFIGPTGIGKTGLAVGIARARVEAGDGGYYAWQMAVSAVVNRRDPSRPAPRLSPGPVWFETWPELKLRLRRAAEGQDVSEGVLVEELLRVPLLVLDDIGLGAYTEWREEILWLLLGRVEDGRRLVVTSNLSPLQLQRVIGERNADRLCDPATFRVVGVRRGESLRQRVRKLPPDGRRYDA